MTWRRLSPSRRYAVTPASTRRDSSSSATVDLPDEGRPVSQTVAPWVDSASQRRARSIFDGWRTTFSYSPVPGPALSRPSFSRRMIMPAPTVSLVASSMRMNEPVARFSA